jgi:hypothetical protein
MRIHYISYTMMEITNAKLAHFTKEILIWHFIHMSKSIQAIQ